MEAPLKQDILELGFSRILARSILRGSWIVELDSDSVLGDYRAVFPRQAEPASGDRIDPDIVGILLLYRLLSRLGRVVQLRQSFFYFAYAGVHLRACRAAQRFSPVGGKTFACRGAFGGGNCDARDLEFRLHFPMGDAHGSCAWRDFVA